LDNNVLNGLFFQMKINLNYNVDIVGDYDLIVAGGGPAGVAAAVAAARKGVKTLIIERYGFLGGATTNNGVNIFMPVKRPCPFYREVVKKLKELNAIDDRHFDPEVMKIVMEEMARDAGADIVLHSWIFDVVNKKGNSVCGVVTLSKGGMSVYTSRCVIDATGDGDVAAFSGEEFTVGRNGDGKTQPMTLMATLFSTDRVHKTSLSDSSIAYKEFVETPIGKNLSSENRFGCLLVNMTRIAGNGIDPKELTRAEIEGRRQLAGVIDLFKRNGYLKYHLAFSGPFVGVRETRLVKGMYTLTAEDLTAGIDFEDGITWCDYVMDIHNPNGSKGTKIQHVKPYTVPYRCMLPRKNGGLLITGRAISTTHEAISSVRIIPQCYGLGEAAGYAAVLARECGWDFRKVDVKRIRAWMEIDN